MIFQFTEYKRVTWSDLLWEYLCGTGALALVFHFFNDLWCRFYFSFIHIAWSSDQHSFELTYRLCVQRLGVWLLKIIATIFIIIGFLLLLIPLSREKQLREQFRSEKKETLGIYELEHEL